MGKLKFAALGVVIALFGCLGSASGTEDASNAPPAVASTNHNALRDIWQGCLAAAIREVDDHISTASDVATAVQNRCQAEYDQLNRSFNFSPEMMRLLNEERFSRTKEVATILVLEVRGAGKANKK